MITTCWRSLARERGPENVSQHMSAKFPQRCCRWNAASLPIHLTCPARRCIFGRGIRLSQRIDPGPISPARGHVVKKLRQSTILETILIGPAKL